MVGFGQDADAASVHRFFPALDIDIANWDLQQQHLKDDDKSRPFTVVSEPDVQVHQHPGGKISIELLGINAFNGTKRQVEAKPNLRWLSMMIDPDYDGDRFRAGLMNVQPPKRKNRILRQRKNTFGKEIDDAKFQQMQMTESLPFTPGERVAVNAIDQNGMEHMAVWIHLKTDTPTPQQQDRPESSAIPEISATGPPPNRRHRKLGQPGHCETNDAIHRLVANPMLRVSSCPSRTAGLVTLVNSRPNALYFSTG